jgi:hypothetical protein
MEDEDFIDGVSGGTPSEETDANDEGHEASGGDAEGQEESDEGQETESLQEDEGRVLASKPSKGNRDFGTLRAQNRELAEQTRRIAQELEDLKRAQYQAAQPRVDHEAERRRYEAMAPEERMEYRLGQIQAQTENQAHQMRMQMWDVDDRGQYNVLAAQKDTRAAKRAPEYADRVEKVFQEKLRAGAPVDRITILKYLIGEDDLKAPLSSKRAAAGKQNIDRQRTAPLNGRGDTGAKRGGKTPEERLEGVFI